jgi:hypothetical protein
MNKRNLIINSTTLFVIATILQMTLHEVGHFAAAIVLHSTDIVLFHNYVLENSLSLIRSIIVAAAGPIFSLLIGITFNYICSIYKKRNTLFLFFLYMSVFGYINFMGYLMIAPFFIQGDSGYIFNALKFPILIPIIIAVIGAVSLFFILKNLSKFFIEMSTDEIIENPSLRKEFTDSLVSYPLFIGIVITSLLNLPVPVFLSLIYPLCSPFALMWCYGFLLKANYSKENVNKNFNLLNKFQPQLLIILILIIIMNRLLVLGIHFN